jgi:glycosyltransferase involved in cell wall biosynthesis
MNGRLIDAKVYIIGTDPPDWLEALASDRLVVTGYVSDLTSYLNHCKLSIAPLRYGAGVKGKVVLSMSHGLPVVGSSVAAEGIPATPGRDILIGDDPLRFVDGVDRLYHDEALWNAVSEAGLRVVEEHFSFDAARARILDTLDALGFERRV